MRDSQAGGCTIQRTAFARAFLLVRVFYATNLFWAAWRAAAPTHWDHFAKLQPLWPLFWADGMEVQQVTEIVLLFNLACAIGAAILPTWRLTRGLACVGVLLAVALDNSFGQIGHSGYTWVWVTFFFTWLPSGGEATFQQSRRLRQHYLHVFWAAQFAVLFFYSISGVLKLVPVPLQMLRGEVSSIAPEALARHIANRSLQTNSNPLLAGILIDHVALSWPLYLGAIYLELCSVIVAFRHDLHRLWGSNLILLHVGIGLTMEIWFVPPIFLAALLFVNSPYNTGRVKWRHIVRQLPGIGLIVYLASRRRLRLSSRPKAIIL